MVPRLQGHKKTYHHNVSLIKRSCHFQGHPRIYQAFTDLLGNKPIDCMSICFVIHTNSMMVCCAHYMNDFVTVTVQWGALYSAGMCQAISPAL